MAQTKENYDEAKRNFFKKKCERLLKYKSELGRN